MRRFVGLVASVAAHGLRGANSPLPHCGRTSATTTTRQPTPTRGEFAPPSLRQVDKLDGWLESLATRGEFAPPSLRRWSTRRSRIWFSTYEGRIRPSLIAAKGGERGCGGGMWLRGANSPLPHCGGLPCFAGVDRRLLRGANSPLPHCGPRSGSKLNNSCIATRGEFAPPSLRRGRRPRPGGDCGATRGEFAPPSLRRPSGELVGDPAVPTRGEFAPPSLRQPHKYSSPPNNPTYEGRIRPSLIAATMSRFTAR